MKRSNKALYEKIMLNVSKEVKKVLNEQQIQVFEDSYIWDDLNDIFDEYNYYRYQSDNNRYDEYNEFNNNNLSFHKFRNTYTYKNMEITNITKDPETGLFKIWSGNPESDDAIEIEFDNIDDFEEVMGDIVSFLEAYLSHKRSIFNW